MTRAPLVAICRSSQQQHQQCLDAAQSIVPPMLTCWPVLTEAAYLLRDKPNEVRQLLANCRQGLLQILPLTVTDVPRMQSILDRFSDQHFQLADVALMHLAEREGFVKVFTLDHRDFSVFRKSDGTSLTMFPVNT